MFDKLRNKFILGNIIIASIIIIAAFISIFVATTANMSSPSLAAATITWLDEDSSAEIRNLLEDSIQTSNSEHMANLALVLVFVGLAVEALVFIASYYASERAIRPIREYYAKQKEFIANASHELKTPIAIVQANFEALGTRKQPWTGNIETNLARATNLINDLLLLARVDQAKIVVQKTPTRIDALIKEQVRGFQPRLESKTVQLSLKADPAIIIAAADLIEILNILIDNAAKYSRQTMEITYANKIITIMNDGKTISKAKLDKLFDRFYQLDKTSEGSGLGLAIAKEISNKNGWELSAASRNGLTTFRIAL